MKIKATNTLEYIAMFPKWKEQLESAYSVIQEFPLEEHIKWGAPCFTYNRTNIVGLTGFKNHCAVWFHKGSLLSDPNEVLVNAQPGKTKLLRQLCFRESEQVSQDLLKQLIAEAIQLEK